VTSNQESLASSVLWLAFATMLLVSGISNTFPVFFPALLQEFGGSRAATGATASLFWIGGAAIGPLAGYLVSRSSPRLVVVAGLVAVAAGLGLGTLATSLTWFVVLVGVGGGIGVGLTGMTTQAALIADRYARRRGFAMGIAFSGSMAGYVLAPPAQWAVSHLGWRGAFWCYVLAIGALTPCSWAIHPRRLRAVADTGPARRHHGEPGVGAILASLPFWCLFLMFSTPPLFGYLATTQHAVYFTGRGFSATTASLLLGAGGVLATFGRALAGWLADRLGGPVAGFLSFGCSLAGMLCLLGMELRPATAALLAYGYVLLLFLPFGSRATIVSVLVGRIAPPAHYGAIFGLLGVGNNLGAAAGPWLSGRIFDVTGSYLAIYLWAMAVALIGLTGLVLFCLTTRDAGRAWA
jgi:predicted MFS family arabinose efflux permease